MASGNSGKSKLTRRQKTLIFDWLVPVGLLVSILLLAAATSYLVTEPLFHPNLHPRLVKLYSNLVHYHPRICKYGPVAVYAGVISLYMLAQTYPFFCRYRVRKHGLINRDELKSKRYLNQTIEQEIGLLPPEAWKVVSLALPGLFVDAPDIRGTHWEAVTINEVKREIKLVLRYVHNPQGIKVWRLYPRRMECTVKLRGKGVRTNVALTYKADSAMDYRTVYAIIDQTNKNIKASLEAEKALIG